MLSHSTSQCLLYLSLLLSKTQLQKALSLYAGALPLWHTHTSSMGMWYTAGATKGVTSLAAHNGIWHVAGATKSWFHSTSLQKSFALIKEVSRQVIFLSMWKEERSEMAAKYELETQKMNPYVWKGMVPWNIDPLLCNCPVIWFLINCVWTLSFSLFLWAKVGFGCSWFVVQNWRILPETAISFSVL